MANKNNKKVTYLKNKDLLEEVIKCKKEGKMSDTLAKMLQLLTAKYSKSAKYAGYTFNEDMQAFAMMSLCKTWNGFNPEKSNNPFAYYTQCIDSSFKQYLNKEKVQRVVRDELLVEQGLNPSHTYVNEHGGLDHHFVYDEEDHHQIEYDIKQINESIEKEEDFTS